MKSRRDDSINRFPDQAEIFERVARVQDLLQVDGRRVDQAHGLRFAMKKRLKRLKHFLLSEQCIKL